MKNNYFFLVLFFWSSLAFSSVTCDTDKVKSYFDLEVTLSEPQSIQAVEKKETVKIDTENGMKVIPFGRLNAEWNTLKDMHKDGDCLLFIRTRDATWKAFHGWEGYILIRDNEPIFGLITSLN